MVDEVLAGLAVHPLPAFLEKRLVHFVDGGAAGGRCARVPDRHGTVVTAQDDLRTYRCRVAEVVDAAVVDAVGVSVS